MYYKKMILLCLLPFFLFASDKKADTKELFDYSSLPIKEGLRVYAAKVSMQNFVDDHSYSIGFLHQSKDLNTEVGIGYMQPVDQVNALFAPIAFKTLSKEEGLLFFIHCHF